MGKESIVDMAANALHSAKEVVVSTVHAAKDALTNAIEAPADPSSGSASSDSGMTESAKTEQHLDESSAMDKQAPSEPAPIEPAKSESMKSESAGSESAISESAMSEGSGDASSDAKRALLAHPPADKIGGVRRPHHAHGRLVHAADLGIVEGSHAGALIHPPSPTHASKINPSTFQPANMYSKHQHERPKEMPRARQEPGSRYFQKGGKVPEATA